MSRLTLSFLVLSISCLSIGQTRALEYAYLQCPEPKNDLRELSFFGEAPPPLLKVQIIRSSEGDYTLLFYGYTKQHMEMRRFDAHPVFNRDSIDVEGLRQIYGRHLEVQFLEGATLEEDQRIHENSLFHFSKKGSFIWSILIALSMLSILHKSSIVRTP